MVAPLEWNENAKPLSWFALRNGHVVGWIVKNQDRRYIYRIDGISASAPIKSHGITITLRTAKQAVERAWQKWCQEMRLTDAG